MHWQGCIMFSLFGFVGSSTNIRWYVWCWHIEGTDLEEVSKILTNMCQEDTDILNVQGCHSKSCIMHYFPIIPTCARPFLTNKDEPFDDDLRRQLSEIIKANNLVKKFPSSGMKTNTMDLQRLVFCINTYYNNRKKTAGILPRVMHSSG